MMASDERARHESFMRIALEAARTADREGDMGAGALVVRDWEIVGRGRNRIRTRCDPIAHAETEAISDACGALGTRDLGGCTLYTTMEPCPMCAGAIMLSGIRRWVVGGRHASVGRTDLGLYSVESFAAYLDTPIDLTAGVLQAECEAVRKRWSGR